MHMIIIYSADALSSMKTPANFATKIILNGELIAWT